MWGRKHLEIAQQLTVLGIPLAAGIAILRYRLYDIDLLIKRTLVYGSLTAVLGLVYVVSVLLSQQALRGLTGGSDIAVAGSTLLVVALSSRSERASKSDLITVVHDTIHPAHASIWLRRAR